jgi:hypothetical protein
MLTAHLTSAAGGKKISVHMTAYQVFKVVLNALGETSELSSHSLRQYRRDFKYWRLHGRFMLYSISIFLVFGVCI